ncbi:hypothetical protein [Escherichia coli]|uniref:hypothetical protein n=1 Tax=Escherichia coli TaxID=562 RepID=UPI00301BB5C3
MDSVHHIWCPLSSQEYQDLPDGAETTLTGILLSECERLRQRSLANKLISLFRQFGGTELRLKLVWLCWLDLMTGNCLDDWTENLKRKSEKELEEWIINRQKQSAALTDLMDQYVLLAYRTTVDDKRT